MYCFFAIETDSEAFVLSKKSSLLGGFFLGMEVF